MPVSTRSYAIAATSAVLIAGVGFYAAVNVGSSRPCGASAVMGGTAAIGGPFTLVDETGATVTDADVLTKPSLVYFGYTFCPDVCPLDNARNAEAVDALEDMGYDVQPIFISVDPGRDTPAQLTEWTDYIHPRLLGLTGTDAQIKVAVNAYKSYYKVPTDPQDDYYLVDHMAHTYLMLPGTGFAEFFGRDVTPEDMAQRTACFIDAANNS